MSNELYKEVTEKLHQIIRVNRKGSIDLSEIKYWYIPLQMARNRQSLAHNITGFGVGRLRVENMSRFKPISGRSTRQEQVWTQYEMQLAWNKILQEIIQGYWKLD